MFVGFLLLNILTGSSIMSSGAGDICTDSNVKSGLAGDETDQDLLLQWQEQALLPLKEDLVDWLQKVLGKC